VLSREGPCLRREDSLAKRRPLAKSCPSCCALNPWANGGEHGIPPAGYRIAESHEVGLSSALGPY